MDTRQSTIETLQYNINWNHVRFNLRLFGVWVGARAGAAKVVEAWPPPDHWWGGQPSSTQSHKFVDLHDFATPQPLLFREWKSTAPVSPSAYRVVQVACLTWLILSFGLLGWLARLAVKQDLAKRERPG
jgi:hypothetical protein